MNMDQGVVVVTGAGAGAGRAIAQRFGREGWRVALLSREPGRLQAARRDIEAAGGQALVLPTDVADPRAVFAALDRVLETWGGIDAWINCAMATVVGPIEQLAPEDFKRVVEVTLLGYVYGTQAALAAMKSRNRGAIIQVGSALAYRAIPLQSAYCSCKFAIRGFTDSLRAELRHQGSGITVSMLQMPGMNTIQFDWARNLFPTKYQPVGEVFDPDVAAEAVWRGPRLAARAVGRRQRDPGDPRAAAVPAAAGPAAVTQGLRPADQPRARTGRAARQRVPAGEGGCGRTRALR
jgi:NAD(P)-dependent dehydrogenase (short-subunit alcohol dehydrogenase family)